MEAKELPADVKKKLAPHFKGFDLEQIRIHRGIPRHILWFAAIEPRAYASRCHLFFSDGAYDPDSRAGIALIGHEAAHCRQYAEHGTWRFRLKYLGCYFKNRLKGMAPRDAYESIPFEKEAVSVQKRIHDDLTATSAAPNPQTNPQRPA